ncbi:MAG: hypothetical protein ACLGH0_10485, partial [Thermoanaerobaculia bacterium]
ERATLPEGTTRVTEIKPATKETIARGAKLARKPRVATYKPWQPSMDEGWTRWLLDTYGVPVQGLTPQELQKGLAGFDAVILPDVHKEILATGRRRAEGAMRYEEEMPPEYRGALGPTGADALRKFVESGGTLLAFGDACDYVLEEFNVPVRNALAGLRPDDYSNPGSLVRLHLRGDHPVTAGMPSETAAFLDSAMAFDTTAPANDTQRWVLATYPEDERDILLSGWIHGANRLTRKAALVAVTYGKGKIVLYGFRPQHRGQTHATFPLVFNALWWSLSGS